VFNTLTIEEYACGYGIFWCICDRNMKVADISGNHFYQRGE